MSSFSEQQLEEGRMQTAYRCGTFDRTADIVAAIQQKISEVDPRDAAGVIFWNKALMLVYSFEPSLQKPELEMLTDDLPF